MANLTSVGSFRMLAALYLLACCAVSLISSEAQIKDETAESSTKAAAHTAAPKVIKLDRQSIILPKTEVRAGKRKNFYSAKITVGEPAQDFHVSFDLAGGTLVLPSKDCTDHACLERRHYDKWISVYAEDIQANGHLVQANHAKTLLRRRDHGTLQLHSIDMGSGQVSGTFVRDQVCVYGVSDDPSGDDMKREPRCFPVAMLIAHKMADRPFALEPYDGTIGLGLKGMSVSPEFNFLADFHRGYGDGHGVTFANSFGLHIGSDADGAEITLGGYDVKRLTNPLQWAPVADPDEGRWQVAISAIRVGNHTFDACHDRVCRAAIDYSSSLLGVPTSLAGGLETVLARMAPPSGFGDGCQPFDIPDLHLELQNGVTLTVPSEDFVSDIGSRKGLLSSPSCNPRLTHHDPEESLANQDVFILGESTLRRYYTFFNADTLSVGFSLAAGSKGSTSSLELPGNDGDKKRKSLEGDITVVLVQVRILKSKTVSSLGM